ncbi:MAG: HEAT repeat domain-containing protein [Actinomycetota bacterium]|nr:HEAT repeat domain-containing protein [Actinomycetota bacterium]
MRLVLWGILGWLALNVILLSVWFAYGRYARARRQRRQAGVQLEEARRLRAVTPPRRATPPDPIEVRRAEDLDVGFLGALIGALRDPYPPSRREAVRALKAIGHPRAIPPLAEVAESDPSAEVREEAAEALATLRMRGSGSGA